MNREEPVAFVPAETLLSSVPTSPAVTDSMLLAAKGSSEALSALFDAAKARNPRISLGSLCRSAKITSKGYLSNVLNGHRHIHPKHIEGLSVAFKLDPIQSAYLKTLAEREHDSAPEKYARLLAELRSCLIARHEGGPPPGTENSFFSLEVFAALGLFDSRATEDDLASYFGEETRPRISLALRELVDVGAVERDSEGCVLPTKSFVMFQGANAEMQRLRFLQHSTEQSARDMAYWFARPSESFLSATLISVKRADFLKALVEFRRTIMLMQCQLDAAEADDVVRFNVQIYPMSRQRAQKTR